MVVAESPNHRRPLEPDTVNTVGGRKEIFMSNTHNQTSEKQLPNSKRTYVAGQTANVRVPFREISLNVTKSMNGSIEVNEPVRVYETSGPWGDPSF